MPHFSSRFPQAILLFALSIGFTASCLFAQSSIESLKSSFKNPPAEAKPMVRWWWFGAAVEKPEILHELQQMKTDGIGGAELAFVYPEVLDDPAKGLKNLPFLSPAMLDAVHYAQAEGRLLTLQVPVPANATSVIPPPLEEGEAFISASITNLAATPPCGFAY